MEFRHYFVSDEDYDEFIVNCTPENFAILRRKSLDEIQEKSKIPSDDVQIEITEKLDYLCRREIKANINSIGANISATLTWEGETTEEISLPEIHQIEAMDDATEREKLLIKFIDSATSGSDLADFIWEDIKNCDEFIQYKKEIQELIDKINELIEEYPSIEWWNL
jgi:hypothetical protein